MTYLLGIDIGTSGTKAVLFDETLNQIVSATVNYEMQQPFPSWAEQDPKVWWDSTCQSINKVVKFSNVNPNDIKGIGLSGQMHGLVMLDENNQPLRPAILWCDQRTAIECKELTKMIGNENLIKISGNLALTGFTASKIRWVEKNESELFKKCRKILLPKDYVRFCLTGVFATEYSDASGTQILDIRDRKWSKEIIKALNINENMLPALYESNEITGFVTMEAALKTGLLYNTPVVGGAGDQAASAIGNGIVHENKMSITIGSSGVVFAQTNQPLSDPLGRVQTFCHALPNKWHVMGVTQAAGTSMKWAKDQLCNEEVQEARKQNVDVYNLINEEINEVSPVDNGLLYLPYLLGERTPHLDANARGVFFGITNLTTKKQMLRAVMEGVSYSLLDGFMVIKTLGITSNDICLAGGGSKSEVWTQMIADIFNNPISITNVNEAGALGCAVLAGVGVGIFPSIEYACDHFINNNRVIKPIKENVILYQRYYPIYQSLYTALKLQFAALSKVNQHE